MLCPKCGNEIQDGTKFCDKCGNLLTFASASNDTTGNAGNMNGQVTKKQFLMLGMAGALVVVIAFTIIIFNKVRGAIIFANTKVGDTITLGFYEQDGDTSNGKEPIEWQVLAKEDGKVLVISKHALEAKPYNNEHKDITWEKCSLRKWLNNDFYKNAFTLGEKNKIVETNVTADKNPMFDTNTGNNTYDMVFLLSIDEANRYFGSDESRKCTPTRQAGNNGVRKYSNGCCFWWLRSPGGHDSYAAGVGDDGAVYCTGGKVSSDKSAVRPVLWINI